MTTALVNQILIAERDLTPAAPLKTAIGRHADCGALTLRQRVALLFGRPEGRRFTHRVVARYEAA